MRQQVAAQEQIKRGNAENASIWILTLIVAPQPRADPARSGQFHHDQAHGHQPAKATPKNERIAFGAAVGPPAGGDSGPAGGGLDSPDGQ